MTVYSWLGDDEVYCVSDWLLKPSRVPDRESHHIISKAPLKYWYVNTLFEC